MVAELIFDCASKVMRLWRASKTFSLKCARALAVKGMPENWVLMPSPVARLRDAVSAAMKPPGVRLIPLKRIDAGPSSEFCSCDSPELPGAVVKIKASLLALTADTVELNATVLLLASAETVSASVALEFASM